MKATAVPPIKTALHISRKMGIVINLIVRTTNIKIIEIVAIFIKNSLSSLISPKDLNKKNSINIATTHKIIASKK